MQYTITPWSKRIFLLLTGLVIAHLGVTLFLQANLGSDPFNVFVQGLYRRIGTLFPLTHGWVHMGISFVIILTLLVIDRKYIRIGTLICMVLGGPIIDGFTLLLGNIIHAESPIVWRFLCLALGCVILAFGMTIVINSEAGTGPNDLIAVVLSEKTGKKFGIVRVVVDVCFAILGFLLGGTFGSGTLICSFLVGPLAQVFLPITAKLCLRVAKPPHKR